MKSGRPRSEQAQAAASRAAGRQPTQPFRPWPWGAALLLALAAFAAYLPSLRNDLLDWDDNKYVTENPHLRHGLTWDSIEWSFTSRTYGSNWHPLTWLAHAADISIWGLDHPWGHHLTNLILHAANAALLLLVLHRLTRRLWPSIVVAALFALRPLHVESVAWVAERKDVLSTLFMFLTILAYAAYAERPAWRRYALVVLGFAAALASKPMAVTLPFVLLLLDYWPLKRLSWRTVAEKLPLVAMTVASCIVTYLAQEAGGAVVEQVAVSLHDRLAHAVYAYVMYLVKAVWPAPGTLVPLYPLPQRGGDAIPPWLVGALLLLLAAVSVAAVALRRRWPYLVVGWLLYLGMLVPVIGLVQVGSQVMADRYTYVPLVGVFLAAVWLADDLLSARRAAAKVALAGALTLCLGLGLLTWRQQDVWRDSVTLWTFVSHRYPGSGSAHNGLGHAYELLPQPDLERATACYRAALEAEPTNFVAAANLGNNLRRAGRRDEAAACYRRALSFSEEYAPAHSGYGLVLYEQDKFGAAIVHLRRALELEPEGSAAQATRMNLAAALVAQGDFAAAEREYRLLIREQPDSSQAWNNLGLALSKQGRGQEAQACFDKADELDRLAKARQPGE